MSADYIELSQTVGTVAAILTGIEFIVGMIAIIALRPLMHGLWLLKLHYYGRLTLRKKDIKRRMIKKEVTALVIALWFALAVALVENSLDSRMRVVNTITKPDRCARVDSFYDYFVMELYKPPFHYSIDEWSLNIATQLGCLSGIETIHFGGSNGIELEDNQISLSAPVCRQTPINSSDVFSDGLYPNLRNDYIKLYDASFRSKDNGLFYDYPRIYILPFNENVGKSRSRQFKSADPYVTVESCEALDINAAPARHYNTWDLTKVDDYNISLIILKRICDEIKFNKNTTTLLPEPVSKEAIHWCVREGNFLLNVSCISNFASPNQKATVNITDVAFHAEFDVWNRTDFRTIDELLFDKDVQWATRAMACPEVDIQVTFILISTWPILLKIHGTLDAADKSYHNQIYNMSNILLPISYNVPLGSCHPAMPLLGYSGLLHMTNANWTNSSLASMDKKVLYQTFLLSMAKSSFSFNEFRRQRLKNEVSQNGSNNLASSPYNCTLRVVEQVTLIMKNYSFYILIMIICISFIVVLFALLFILMYPKNSWEISKVDIFDKHNSLNISSEHGEEIVVGNISQNLIGEDSERDIQGITLEVKRIELPHKNIFRRKYVAYEITAD